MINAGFYHYVQAVWVIGKLDASVAVICISK